MSNSFSKGGQNTLRRRTFLKAGLGVAAAPLLSRIPAGAQSQQAEQSTGDGAATDKGRLTKIDHRRLGSLEVSAIGLGCLPMVGYYGGGPRDKRAMVSLTRQAFDGGVTFFDTAEVYGPF